MSDQKLQTLDTSDLDAIHGGWIGPALRWIAARARDGAVFEGVKKGAESVYNYARHPDRTSGGGDGKGAFTRDQEGRKRASDPMRRGPGGV